jgi:L-lactate dehydrogenase complex protein LldG
MSSRQAILQAIRQSRPAPPPLPEPPGPVPPAGELAAHFARLVTEIGGRVVELAAGADLGAAVRAAYPEARTIAAGAGTGVEGTVRLDEVFDPHDLAALDLLVCTGVLGVAENGAVWLPESRLGHRAAAFITQHLAIVLERDRIVWDMAEAYARLRVDEEGFGVFIAGPSKTADIEQSLVIGAHGARSLTVVLTG